MSIENRHGVNPDVCGCDDAAFLAHLEYASQEVAKWPEWKRNLMGTIPKQPRFSENPRKPECQNET
jgi:hypothetical protein